MKIEENELARALLKKLYDMGCWGERHVCESNLPKGFPKHLRGKVADIAERLRKEGFLVKRPSSHEHQWFLNYAKKEEIEKIIE